MRQLLLLIVLAFGLVGPTISYAQGLGVNIDPPVSILHVYQNNGAVGTAAGITVEQDGAGDAILQYALTGGTRWVSGLDNSDGNKYKIASSANLGSNTRMTILTNGDVGIRTANPADLFHVSNGSPGGGNHVQFLTAYNQAEADSYNLGMSTTDPARIKMTLEDGSFRQALIFADVGVITENAFGIGWSGNSGGTWNPGFVMRADGLVGVGTNSPAVRFEVQEAGATVAAFNRTTNDGTIISIQQAGVQEGTISVAGAVVSFNPFTGSHFAWSDQIMEKGLLVSLTGNNEYYHDNPVSEIIYGVQVSQKPNDPRVMGSYLGMNESNLPLSTDNPLLIMSVGNGQMWVVENGNDLEVGDFLISSDVPGHAMKDPGNYPISYIVGRVAEPVNWEKEGKTINGKKHKLISVFFENFVFENTLNLLEKTQSELEVNRSELNDLKKRILQLEEIIEHQIN